MTTEGDALPAISLGVKLDPFTPGDISYLLRLIMGYLLAQRRCWRLRGPRTRCGSCR